jgi:hypothetical protein
MTPGTSPQAVVHHFVMRAKRLYSLPAVAMRVLELTGESSVDTQALTECIENDPALAAKILRVVNSSVYGLSQRVGSAGDPAAENTGAGFQPAVESGIWIRDRSSQPVLAAYLVQGRCGP